MKSPYPTLVKSEQASEQDSTHPVINPKEKHFNLAEAAKHIGMSKSGIKAAIDRGELYSTVDRTVGRAQYAIPLSHLLAYQNLREERGSVRTSAQDSTQTSVRGSGVTKAPSTPENSYSLDQDCLNRHSDNSTATPRTGESIQDSVVNSERDSERASELREPTIPLSVHREVVSTLNDTLDHERKNTAQWSEQAKRAQLFLTDQREKEKKEIQQGRAVVNAVNKWTLRIILLSVLGSLLWIVNTHYGQIMNFVLNWVY